MGLGMSLCLSQVTTCRQELRLDTDGSCLRESDLPRSARVLPHGPASSLRKRIHIEPHWRNLEAAAPPESVTRVAG